MQVSSAQSKKINTYNNKIDDCISEPLDIYKASVATGCLEASTEACKAPSNHHAIVLGTLLNIWQYKIFY